MNSFSTIFASFICILIMHTNHAQNLVFDHYYSEHGFLNAQALNIEKDKEGYYWIGTESGLVRYDAHNFLIFRSEYQDSTTISSNYVSKLKTDKHNRLWLASGLNLNIFNPITFKVEKIIRFDEKLNTGRILNFQYDDKNDVMWISTEGGLFYNQGMDLNVRRETIESDNSQLPGGYSLIVNDSTIWICNTYGLYKHNPLNCEVKSFDRPGKNKAIAEDNGFFTMYPEGDSVLWLGGWIHGLYRFNIKSEIMENYTWADPAIRQNGIVSIASLMGDFEHLWLATTSGILLFNKISRTFKSLFTENKYDPTKIPGSGFCFFNSSDGFWIGTYKGLHRYDQNKDFLKKVVIKFPVQYGSRIPENVCFEHGKLTQDSIVWFTSSYGDIFRFDLSQEKMMDIPPKLKAFCTGRVIPFDMLLSGNRYLWFSSLKSGLLGYDLLADSFIHSPDYFRHTDRILTIKEGRNNKLWLGALDGIYELDRIKGMKPKKNAQLEIFFRNNDLSQKISVFDTDSQGNVWIAKYNDREKEHILIKFNPGNSEILNFKGSDYPEFNKIGIINNLKITSDDRIVLAGLNDFLIFKLSNDKIVFEKINKGAFKFFGNCVSIQDDKNGNIYISNDTGIIRYSNPNDPVIHFNNLNALIGEIPATPIFYSRNSSRLYISNEYLISFFDQDILDKLAPVQVRLTGISIKNYKSDFMPESGEKMILKHNQNNIELTFSNMSFTNSQQNIYVYELSGNIRQSLTSHKNFISFNSLSDGNYFLKVRSYNSFGYPAAKEFSLEFKINPPFWKSWWFNLLIVMLISSVIYTFFRMKDIQRQKLEKLRISIARDLHDDMGSSLSYIRMLSEKEAFKRESREAEVFLNIAKKTSDVMESMSEIIWSINPANDSFVNILLKVQEFAINTLEQAGIKLKFEIGEIPENVTLSVENRRNYYLIFKEAINNISKYSRADEVTFSVSIDKNQWVTKIIDNGTGFDPVIISKGQGLKNMRSRAEGMGADIDISTGKRGTSVTLVMKF